MRYWRKKFEKKEIICTRCNNKIHESYHNKTHCLFQKMEGRVIFKEQLKESLEKGNRAFWYYDFHGDGQSPSPKQSEIFEYLFAKSVDELGYKICDIKDMWPMVYVVEPKSSDDVSSVEISR